MVRNKKVLVIGGDTVAFAVNYVLANHGLDTTVICPNPHPKISNPYSNGPFNFTRDGGVLRRMLQELDMPFSQYRLRLGVYADGGISQIKNVNAKQLSEYWAKSRATEPKRVTARAAFNDTEYAAYSRTGIKFDYKTFANELIDIASPVYGIIEQVNMEDGDLCIRIPQLDNSLEYACFEFDHIVFTNPVHEWISFFTEELEPPTMNTVVQVRYGGTEFMEHEVIYMLSTSAIHRITHVDGLHVCEANSEYSLEQIYDDLVGVFGAGHFVIESINTTLHYGYHKPQSFVLPKNVQAIGTQAVLLPETLADALDYTNTIAGDMKHD